MRWTGHIIEHSADVDQTIVIESCFRERRDWILPVLNEKRNARMATSGRIEVFESLCPFLRFPCSNVNYKKCCNFRPWEPEKGNIGNLDFTRALQRTLNPSQRLASRKRDIFWHQLASTISLERPFLKLQVETDYLFVVILREEVNEEISCRVPLLRSNYLTRTVCGENSVVSRLLVHPLSKVEQDGCERLTGTQNCAERAYGMDL